VKPSPLKSDNYPFIKVYQFSPADCANLQLPITLTARLCAQRDRTFRGIHSIALPIASRRLVAASAQVLSFQFDKRLSFFQL
jgi:hypothetical protein